MLFGAKIVICVYGNLTTESTKKEPQGTLRLSERKTTLPIAY
jgi:hypothetical protein